MKHPYHVVITVNVPYPGDRVARRSFEFREDATSGATAVARAMRELPKRVRESLGRSKQITSWSIRVAKG